VCVFQGGPGPNGAKGESGDSGPQVTFSLDFIESWFNIYSIE